MNRRIILAMALAVTLGILACNGKKGDNGATGATGATGSTGPTGPGSTLTTYSGTATQQITNVDTPVLTADSFVTVRVSSNSVDWRDINYTLRLNLTNKTVEFYIENTYWANGESSYKIYVQNPS